MTEQQKADVRQAVEDLRAYAYDMRQGDVTSPWEAKRIDELSARLAAWIEEESNG